MTVRKIFEQAAGRKPYPQNRSSRRSSLPPTSALLLSVAMHPYANHLHLITVPAACTLICGNRQTFAFGLCVRFSIRFLPNNNRLSILLYMCRHVLAWNAGNEPRSTSSGNLQFANSHFWNCFGTGYSAKLCTE